MQLKKTKIFLSTLFIIFLFVYIYIVFLLPIIEVRLGLTTIELDNTQIKKYDLIEIIQKEFGISLPNGGSIQYCIMLPGGQGEHNKYIIYISGINNIDEFISKYLLFNVDGPFQTTSHIYLDNKRQIVSAIYYEGYFHDENCKTQVFTYAINNKKIIEIYQVGIYSQKLSDIIYSKGRPLNISSE